MTEGAVGSWVCEFTEEDVRAERPSAMAEKVVRTALLLTFEESPPLADYSDLVQEAYQQFMSHGRTHSLRRNLVEKTAAALAKRANVNRAGHSKPRKPRSDLS